MKKKMSMEVVCSDCGALIQSDCDLKEVGLLDGDGDILKYSVVKVDDRKHSAEKPVKLLRKLIAKSIKENMIVLDPFIGSGTTAIACKQLKCHFIGFEIEKSYYDISLNRLLKQSKRLDEWIQT